MRAERPFEPRGYYHVGTRGNFGQPLFEKPEYHEIYLRVYNRVALKYGWTTLDWCLLWNHTHFLVRLGDCGLSHGMQELNASYSRRLNLINGLTGQGHNFRLRFNAEHIETDSHLFEVCRYIPLNPQRAGRCRRPADWQWGGFRANAGLDYPRPFHSTSDLLAIFADKPIVARKRYREWVREWRGSNGLDPSSNEGVQPAT